MEQSIPSQELINLGKKIVKEFSREGRYNTSVQWMGHYLAELIQRSENASSSEEKKSSNKECASLILELWKRRAYYPERLAPASKLTHTISILNSLKSEKLTDFAFNNYSEQDDDSPIGNYISIMRKSFETIFKICLEQTVNENDLNAEREWLEYLPFLKTEERQIIEKLNATLTTGNSTGNKKKKIKKNQTYEKVTGDTVDLMIEKLKQEHSVQLGYLENLHKKLLLQKTKRGQR